MINPKTPKPVLDEIADVIEQLNENWLVMLKKEIVRHFTWDEEGKGTFKVPTVMWDSKDDTYYGSNEYYSFEWYCWRGVIHQLQEPFEPITFYARESFINIVALLDKKLKYCTNPEEAANVVEFVIDDCKATLRTRQENTKNEVFKTTYQFLSERGEKFIRDNFVDLLDYRMPNQNERTIRFNLNQDHLAFLLAAMLEGGIIENTKEEVAEFASKYFLVNKGKGKNKGKEYRPVLRFQNKMNSFLNRNDRITDTAETTIREMIDKGIATVRL